MATITIDGRTFSGSNVSIRNGKVTIDGAVQDGTLNGVVEIKITDGIIGRLDCDASVNCGEVRGNVSAGGSVNCDGIGGNVSAGGSVNADNISGSVNAGGSVRHG